MINLMNDMETLGVTPGSALLSIALVPFSYVEKLEPFYIKIDPVSCTESGLHVDDSTIEWWSKQSKEAYDEAFSGKIHIKVALQELSYYIKSLPDSDIVMWGNGSDFDNVLLASAFQICGMRQPWKYTNNRCYRTLKNLFPQVPFISPEIKHNALHDADAQARHAERIFMWMNRGLFHGRDS